MTVTTSAQSLPALRQIRVMRAMHPGVLACAPDASLRDVAALMATYAVHAVVVWPHGTGARPTVIFARDVVVAALAGDDTLTAAAIAARRAVPVWTDDSLEHAARLMTEHATSHLIVLDADTSHPVGMLSTLDVAAAIAQLPVHSGPQGAAAGPADGRGS